jgi:formylglycine-generating enzyme required for sulfatase activity
MHLIKKVTFRSIKPRLKLIPLLSLLLLGCSTSADRSLVVSQQSSTAPAEQQYSLSDNLHKKLLANMVWIEGGDFEMGSDAAQARNRERPAHQVSLDDFYISKFELTQDIFQQIMGWNNSYFQCANCPVNNVSWFNMQLFIKRLNLATGKNFSLPTEAQWAYAAKGGNKSMAYKFSGSNNIADVAWYSENAQRKSHPVGLKKPNELGLYDMTGNLWEFCLDDMSRNAYKRERGHNPFIGDKANLTKKAMKVIRGGGYEFSAIESLVFMRDGATNNVRMADIGYRLVMTK